MALVSFRWIYDFREAPPATPTGPITTRDGKKVICLTPKQQRLLDLFVRPKMGASPSTKDI